MWKLFVMLTGAAVISCLGLVPCSAEHPGKSNEVPGEIEQELLSFEVTVNGANGEPVAEAKLKPWAIQSSQGHGMWNVKSSGGLEPKIVTTDSEGKATIEYPKFANVEEQVKTMAVTLAIHHPDHPFVTHENVTVPSKSNHSISLPAGSAINVEIMLDGEKVANDNIRATWSGDRSMIGESGLQVGDDKTYRIPPMSKGNSDFMFVRLDGKTVTHFSPIVKVEIDESQDEIDKSVELLPAVKVHGKLSDNVPRPVKNGRIKMQTIGDGESWNEVAWLDWARVDEKGNFAFDWPQDAPVQIVALCDGFIGSNGEKPTMVTPERARGGYRRAQAFLEPDKAPITIEMTPMAQCEIEVENAFGKRLEGIVAGANPNVGWWNSGSQIYGWPLMSSSEILLDPDKAKINWTGGEGIFANPFQAESNSQGIIKIELPVGRTNLWIGNDKFQMAANLGQRSRRVDVKSGELNRMQYVLQPKGLDVLGDWEDLCGLVFG